MRKDLLFAGLLAATLLALAACGRRAEVERIELPPTSVLSIRSTWAVVTSSFLRIRDEPRAAAPVLAHIRRGAVVEILSRTERKEELEDASSYWYQVSYGGLRGWVFGAFLEVFDSKAKAESVAAQLE
jgi:hypothetical protein